MESWQNERLVVKHMQHTLVRLSWGNCPQTRRYEAEREQITSPQPFPRARCRKVSRGGRVRAVICQSDETSSTPRSLMRGFDDDAHTLRQALQGDARTATSLITITRERSRCVGSDRGESRGMHRLRNRRRIPATINPLEARVDRVSPYCPTPQWKMPSKVKNSPR